MTDPARLPVHRYRLGLPAVEVRSLTDDEREHLTAMRRGHRRKMTIGLAITLFVLATCPLAPVIIVNEALAGVFAVWTIGWLFIGLPVLAFWTQDGYQRAKALLGDLAMGTVDVHRGPAAQLRMDAVGNAVARVAGLRDGTDELVLEVASASGQLLAANGVPYPRWLTLPLAEARAAAPIRWADFARPHGDDYDSHFRALSAEERTELGRLRDELYELPLIGFAATGIGALGIFAWLVLDTPAVGGLGFVLGYGIYSLNQARRHRGVAHGLELDIQKNEMLCLVNPALSPASIEMLPRAGLPWSIDGHKADWRIAPKEKATVR